MKDKEKNKVKKITKQKETKKKKVKKGPKESYFKKVGKELKLVKWPTFKEVLKYTISTIVLCLILCALFRLLYQLLAAIKGGL